MAGRRARALVLLAVVVLAAACSDDGDGGRGGGSGALGPEPADTDEPVARDGGEVDVGAGGWRAVAAPATCRCSDGSPYHYWIRAGDPERVLFYLEGGGACFSAETCGPVSPTFQRTLPEPAEAPAGSGVFDLDEDRNPFRGWSMVYVPYCTGDLHLGDAVHDYGDGVVVEHNGAVNASTALAAAAAAFPRAEEVVVAGSSAGAAAAPVYGGLAHDVLPDARITVVADASAAYPGDAAITGGIGGLWGAFENLPPWPSSADEPDLAWSLPGLFVRAGRHVPDIRLAMVNTVADEVQQEFSALIGRPGDVGDAIVANEADIEAEGVEVDSWLGPGRSHTILGRDQLYSVEVGGTSLVEWLRDVVAGRPVDDVRCARCGA